MRDAMTVDERRERGADRRRLVLGQAPVLAHEHARVARRARAASRIVEELVDERVQRVGTGRATDAFREQLGADPALLREQRDEQVVLARGSTGRTT